ncbi:hypothetical protein KAU11_08220, partial [Candidatus Babeliales bacterium]|nr:hypothetical protein [Candidatus Babeliales bacterium]
AAKAAGQTVMRMINGEEVVVQSDLHQARLTVCNTCEEFTGSKCKMCGCNMQLKTRLSGQSCPLSKW